MIVVGGKECLLTQFKIIEIWLE